MKLPLAPMQQGIELNDWLKKISDQTLNSIVKHWMKINFYLKIDSLKLVADPYTYNQTNVINSMTKSLLEYFIF